MQDFAKLPCECECMWMYRAWTCVCDQASHLELTTDLVEDQRTRAEIRSASFTILELSVTMINEHSVTIRKTVTPPCASSGL